MMAKLKLQQQLARQNFVQDVMDRVESLPIPEHKENIFVSVSILHFVRRQVWKGNQNDIIERIGRIFPKNALPTIGLATLTVFTVIGLILPAFGAGVWRKRASMPQKRWSLSTVAVNDKIYTIGGFAANELSAVEEYDPTTDTWTRKTNMPTPRGALSSAVVNGKIYAIGGGDVEALSTEEEYDTVTDTDTWVKKASMPTPGGLHSASMVNGQIYVIGGWAGKLGAIGKALSTVEVYDPAQDRWTKGTEMPTSRWALSTSVVNDKIYAIGGTTVIGRKWATVSDVEVYHPATGKWTKESRMSSPRGWLSTSAVRGKIYAIGGASKYMIGIWDAVLVSTVEEFDTGFAVDTKGKLPTLWGKLKVWQGGKIK